MDKKRVEDSGEDRGELAVIDVRLLQQNDVVVFEKLVGLSLPGSPFPSDLMIEASTVPRSNTEPLLVAPDG